MLVQFIYKFIFFSLITQTLYNADPVPRNCTVLCVFFSLTFRLDVEKTFPGLGVSGGLSGIGV